jgi:two-component system, LytTR family, response regulator
MRVVYDIYILDDNKGSIDALCNALKPVENMHVCGYSISDTTAREQILSLKPDLLFLDVEMPNVSGIDFLQSIRKEISWFMRVVIYTAFEKYMLSALRASAFDFLLKPFVQDELETILNRFFIDPPKSDEFSLRLDTLSTNLIPYKPLLVPTTTGSRILKPCNICYFEYSKLLRYWFLYPDDGTPLKLKRETTAEYLLSQLPTFIQINQQHILNPDVLHHLEGRTCYLKPPYDTKVKLTVSRDCLKGLKDLFESI